MILGIIVLQLINHLTWALSSLRRSTRAIGTLSAPLQFPIETKISFKENGGLFD